MLVSIITVVYNGRETIEDTIESVSSQTYKFIEHIIIDGGSKDGTLNIIEKHRNRVGYFLSEKDKGIYDAMNKGIKAAKGELIGILNSDDLYSNNNVIQDVVEFITKNNVDSCYGDLIYVNRLNVHKISRYWKADEYRKNKFKYGWMPPHPTFFVKKDIYDKYGLLNIDYPLAADYEMMLRFLYKYNVSTCYIPKVLVKMRTGGASRPGKYTIGAIRENYLAWKSNGLNYPITVLLKPYLKLYQYMRAML